MDRGPAQSPLKHRHAIEDRDAVPREKVGDTLIDGGVSNNTPISHALDLGADEAYVLPTGHACALNDVPGGAVAMLVHATTLLVQQRLVRGSADLHDAIDAELVVLPPPCPLDVNPIDFGRADELVERARADAGALLDRAPRGHVPLSMSVDRLRPHDHITA